RAPDGGGHRHVGAPGPPPACPAPLRDVPARLLPRTVNAASRTWHQPGGEPAAPKGPAQGRPGVVSTAAGCFHFGRAAPAAFQDGTGRARRGQLGIDSSSPGRLHQSGPWWRTTYTPTILRARAS